jgi:hypothetical protein
MLRRALRFNPAVHVDAGIAMSLQDLLVWQVRKRITSYMI